MIPVLVNTVVLTIIGIVIMRDQDDKEYLGLAVIPLALSILALIARTIVNDYYFIPVLIISIPIIKWGLNVILPKAIIAAIIWIGWLALNPIIMRSIFARKG